MRKPKTKHQQSVDLEKRTAETGGKLLLQVQEAIGVPNAEVAGILVAQAAAMPAIEPVGPEKAKIALQTAIQVLEQIKPEGALQSMLAVQMTGAHNAAVKFRDGGYWNMQWTCSSNIE